LTERQAKRRADERLREVNRLDVVPGSLMLTKDFIDRRFKPECVLPLKRGGQVHYEVELKHVIAALGEMPLRSVLHEHVQRMCLNLLNQTYTVGKDRVRKVKDRKTGEVKLITEKRTRQVPYSVQKALHVKNAASAVFEHAKTVNMYSGENPAAHVRLPEMTRKQKHALTVEQMELLLLALPSPAREMAHLAVLCSANVAELCGLQWQAVNLTDSWVIVAGEAVPPKSIVIRLQWSTRKGGGAYHTVKARGRGRFLPIDPDIEKLLRGLASRESFTGAEDPVFVSSTGRPIDAHNLFNRVLKPIGKKLGMPWLGWHVFRHTHASWLRQEAASPADQMAMLGHTDVRTTMMYGEQDLARRRAVVEKMAGRLNQKKTLLPVTGSVQ
jgi:integrase